MKYIMPAVTLLFLGSCYGAQDEFFCCNTEHNSQENLFTVCYSHMNRLQEVQIKYFKEAPLLAVTHTYYFENENRKVRYAQRYSDDQEVDYLNCTNLLSTEEEIAQHNLYKKQVEDAIAVFETTDPLQKRTNVKPAKK